MSCIALVLKFVSVLEAPLQKINAWGYVFQARIEWAESETITRS